MIENKVLITVNVPSLERKYDMYIPVNRKVHNVLDMMKKALFELSTGSFVTAHSYALYNAETGSAYDMNVLVRDTDIRNNSKVILL